MKLESVNIIILAKYVGKFCDRSKIKKENLNEVVFTKIAKKRKKITKKVANKYKMSKDNKKKHKKSKEELEKEN